MLLPLKLLPLPLLRRYYYDAIIRFTLDDICSLLFMIRHLRCCYVRYTHREKAIELFSLRLPLFFHYAC